MQDSQRPSLTAHTEYYWRVSGDPLVVVAWAPSPSSAPGHSVACCPDRDQGTDQASESGLRPSICEVVVQEHANSLPHYQCCLAWWAAEVPAPATVRLPAGSGYSGLGKLEAGYQEQQHSECETLCATCSTTSRKILCCLWHLPSA
jgi:hypothetical protein